MFIIFYTINQSFTTTVPLLVLHENICTSRRNLENSLPNKNRDRIIIPRSVSWVKSFLTGRSQKVRIGSELSSSRMVTTGVPQGGVLSPLIFVLFVSDLQDWLILTTHSFIMCANIVLIYKSRSYLREYTFSFIHSFIHSFTYSLTTPA